MTHRQEAMALLMTIKGEKTTQTLLEEIKNKKSYSM